MIFSNQTVSISNIQNLNPQLIIYRDNIINQTDLVANKQKNLRFVILSGESEIGKTTLSKIYGKQKYFNLKWIINAKSENSIKNSFIDIANSLAAFGSNS